MCRLLGTTLLVAFASAVAACGNANTPDETTPRRNRVEGQDVGSGHVIAPSPTSNKAEQDAAPSGPVAPVTFVLRNSGNDDLTLNMDKGWGAVISAHSGTPPTARSLVMFPPSCTAPCEEDICPVCEDPQRVADILKAERHDAVAPGDLREVPWDGFAVFPKPSKGLQGDKRVSCECTTTGAPEPATYTVRACGLRKTQSAKHRSKYQCVESTLDMPITEPIRVEFDFGA